MYHLLVLYFQPLYISHMPLGFLIWYGTRRNKNIPRFHMPVRCHIGVISSQDILSVRHLESDKVFKTNSNNVFFRWNNIVSRSSRNLASFCPNLPWNLKSLSESNIWRKFNWPQYWLKESVWARFLKSFFFLRLMKIGRSISSGDNLQYSPTASGILKFRDL